ncbi:MAG: TetR/AcrR family transcriptional regulator [Phaeodactylibacter sp.]|uniref:TetR/AcrR family transcriptional regulator n=1 Tax=Phaeodactylibacter sp. TaxID=1940289 RepID=UPI0032ECA078
MRHQSMENIANAALRLFGEQGYHSTSIAQIALAARVSKGLLYNYFESKEALLHFIILHAVEVGEALLEQALAQNSSPQAQLRAFTEGTLSLLQKDPIFWRLLTALAFQQDILEGIMPQLMEKQGTAMAKIIAVFQQLGVNKPEEEAMYFSAVMDGIALQFVQMPDGYPLDRMKERVLKPYLDQ